MIHKRKIGNMGENIACKYLQRNNFHIEDRNFNRRWGELDIVALKDKILHFFEVKSVTSQILSTFDKHRPEDNVNALKVKHISRMIETYYFEKKISMDTAFQFHVICIYMNMKNRLAKVKMIKNIIF